MPARVQLEDACARGSIDGARTGSAARNRRECRGLCALSWIPARATASKHVPSCPRTQLRRGQAAVPAQLLRLGPRLSHRKENMEHPSIIRPSDHAEWRSDRMGKTTLFQSKRLLIGLNSFEPGQFHALHSHEGMDKVYHVVEGEGVVLLEGRELPIAQGELVVAPEGVPHGIRNTGTGRLLVLAVLAPSP